MPAEDYMPATSGSLKLKGVQNSKISKKKKRSKAPPQASSTRDSAASPSPRRQLTAGEQKLHTGSQLEKREELETASDTEKQDLPLHGRGKTEAEIRHEEKRRKRVWFVWFEGSSYIY